MTEPMPGRHFLSVRVRCCDPSNIPLLDHTFYLKTDWIRVTRVIRRMFEYIWSSTVAWPIIEAGTHVQSRYLSLCQLMLYILCSQSWSESDKVKGEMDFVRDWYSCGSEESTIVEE